MNQPFLHTLSVIVEEVCVADADAMAHIAV
jgi:hypothetical protein